MTESPRRVMPWLISLGAHVVVLAVVGLLLAAPTRTPLPPRIEITLIGAPGTGRGALRAAAISKAGSFVPRPPRGEIVPPGGAEPARGSAPPRDATVFPTTVSAAQAESPISPAAAEVRADAASVTSEAPGFRNRCCSKRAAPGAWRADERDFNTRGQGRSRGCGEKQPCDREDDEMGAQRNYPWH
jgi:hypothetical protein